jgi:hypothetical protein
MRLRGERALVRAQDLHNVQQHPLTGAHVQIAGPLARAGSRPRQPAEPLTNPWKGHMDVTLARSLGFQPKVPTVYQAIREGKL